MGGDTPQFGRQLCGVIFYCTLACLTGGAAAKVRTDELEFELSGGGAPGLRSKGLFPRVMNLASHAVVTTNATCGEDGSEVYCKLGELSGGREAQCGVCDGRSPDPTRRHPIERLADGNSDTWWQTPTLAADDTLHYVTVDIDLQQVYQIAYIIVKSAISPRPGNWILERSLDGEHYSPWQYYAVSDRECLEQYGVAATPGRPRYTHDTEVICTSYFSRLTPFEGGEIHTSLVNGRPGASGPSEALREFTEAQHVRLRFQRIRAMEGDLEGRSRYWDTSVARRYFYSLKDISIGGRCVCNGHAATCEIRNGRQKCECEHNTCGDQCDRCCPLHQQQPWRPGNFSDSSSCNQCQCHGHASRCRYDKQTHDDALSLDMRGDFAGGGVCLNCQRHTEGINCDRCQPGYYRPQGLPPQADEPCEVCGCGGPGVTGECVRDDRQFNLGIFPGACICKRGYEGPRCDGCAPGFRNYPACESCPCDRAGSLNGACEGICSCKANVVGERCDVCSTGTFSLDVHNPVGCTDCFCNGATDICDAAKLPVYTVVEHGNWQVSDLLGRRVIAAAQEGTDARVAHDEMAQFSSYYFVAPHHYLGSRLTSYGQTLSVRVTWVKLRGDTSGWALHGPDVILEGAGYRIAYGIGSHKGHNNARIHIPLHEYGWYHFPKDIDDIPASMASSEYQLASVSRAEMMQVLSHLHTLMIRARFHTVQVEAILHGVVLEYGKEGAATTTLVTGAVERCVCPPGYEGLSCESCFPGWRRVNNTVVGGACEKCTCHGHSLSCDPYTGSCGECLHFTTGPNCELCLPGYYGDPTSGYPDACLPCSCPLPVAVNHFTPTCSNEGLTLGTRDNFVCDCPVGYEGLQCERCADGFFGSPLTPGNYCQPCDCSGNVSPVERGVCDATSGECLKCLGNTAGWRCEKCIENHFGDPLRGQCIPCGCVQPGSVGESCDANTGQCQCRHLYVGRQCHRCQDGHGGVHEGCPRCRCSNRGSYSKLCDPVTGECSCKPGVGGRSCSACLEDHYGNLSDGCVECLCDPVGSIRTSCEQTRGQCYCRPSVVGRDCSQCSPGHYGISSGRGCSKCQCGGRANNGGECDQVSGKCICAPGVGGESCDTCLPGFWGFSEQGCEPCEPCGVAGRSCDQNSGRCICPLNTEGDRCERCRPGSWGYSGTTGCKVCQCSAKGSLNQQCDFRTGRCTCRPGFQGAHCEQCSQGYYGTPDCRSCNCHPDGTRQDVCDAHDRCQCDARGQCPCKANVGGRRCERCTESTFGLSASNPLGCTPCYCFRRSDRCEQAPHTWSQVWEPQGRELSVEYGVAGYGPLAPPAVATVIVRPWDTKQICYINLALPGERHLSTDRNNPDSRLNVTNQLHVIPASPAHIVLGTANPFPAPLYWTLTKEFRRDKVRSYNGYLRFRVESTGGTRVFPDSILQTYPLVSLQGNWQLVLEHYPRGIQPDGTYSVRLHEDEWRPQGSSSPVTREMMMIALQNIQHILIRATHSEDVVAASLSDVTLDVATEGTLVSSRRALGVERCICPDNYEGLSCQNPSHGFFRWYKDNFVQSTIVIDLVGESRPCRCNGRSDDCHQETGVCLNCRDNTAGDHCGVCASGYYGDLKRGPCRPCACPSLIQNFAETCEADRTAGYICHCREGYTGDKCDRCAFGYYGRPGEPGGSCVACGCDPNGSQHRGCDAQGRCSCKPGIQGHDCSQCAPRHVVVDTGCKRCEDGCVDVLLDEIEELIREVEAVNTTHFISAPWPKLKKIEKEYDLLRAQLNHYVSSGDVLDSLLLETDLEFAVKDLLRKARAMEQKARRNRPVAADTLAETQDLIAILNSVNNEIAEAISLLSNYAIGEFVSISVASALDEAKDLLKQIQNRNQFSALEQEATIELTKAQALLEKVSGMQLESDYLETVAARYRTMFDNIRQMLDIIRVADTKVERAVIINTGLLTRQQRVATTLEDITIINSDVRDTNFNSSAMLRDAQRNLDRAKNNYERLEMELPRLQNYSSHLSEHEGLLTRLNTEYRTTYVEPAHDHALDLTAKAIQLENLFNETRIGALGPLEAAQAYQRIVDALTSAEEAARNASHAANKAYQVAYPGDPTNSLVRQSKMTRQSSQDLGTKGRALLTKVDELEDGLQRQQDLLHRARGTLHRTSGKLEGLNIAMDTQFNTDLRTDILATLARSEDTHRALDGTLSHVSVMHANLTRFLQFASDVSNFDTSLLNGIREKISEVESNTMQGMHLTTTLHSKADRIETASLDLSERIKALKQKIQQTRQHASSIRVSVSPKKDEVCMRRYSPALQSSTTNSLVLSYAINTRHRDALILYLGNSNASEFVAVEMKDRRIQVTWDVGGGSNTLVHPTMLLTNTASVSDDKRWYHIEFRRVGNIGELQVQPANSEGMSELDLLDLQDPITSASPAGHTSINLHSRDSGVWLGGGPPDAMAKLSTSQFAGCLHYVTVDGAKLGLWNFTSNTGCTACNEGVELIVRQEDEIAFGFNGKGYFRSEPQRSRVKKTYYSVVLAFKTLDEHALLFLATNEEKDQMLSLTVEEGYVVMRVHFDRNTKLVLKSSKRYNNIDDMTTVDATVLNAAMDGKRMGRLAIRDQSQLATVRGGPDLMLGEQPFYFGGVDPQFNKRRWSGVVLRSMLGCMAGLTVLDGGMNPFTDGQFYGIDNACSEKPLSEVGFLGGRGYIELASQQLRRESNFGFTFQTMEANAVLMLSTFVGQPLPEGRTEHPPDYYSVSLVEGHLDLRLFAGDSQHRLISEAKFNDGRLHSFFVLKQNRRVRLLVDDQSVNNTRLSRGGAVVDGPARGGLYFGGVPEGLDIRSMVGSTTPYKGCIRNVIVNNEVVSFTRPKGFEAVYIGRCSDLPADAIRGMEGDVKEVEACQPPTQHTLEYGALKFGDQTDSHALLPIPKTTFADNFNVSFEFRTYYPNGLFFYAEQQARRHGHRGRHHSRSNRPASITVNLQNGRLVVTAKGRRRRAPTVLQSRTAGLNTGQWKKVLIEKYRKSLRVSVDAGERSTSPVTRRLVKATQAYIGGLSQQLRQANDTPPLDPLRGCLRNFHLNGERLDIPQHTRRDHMVGVGQCFAHVQPGSYFPGDAYAIYSDELSVGPLLEFALQFRTWQLNGVLLSVADQVAGTSLALEIVNGAVVLNVNVGEGHSFGARVGFRNRYSLCDNSWHSIRAHFVKDSLTLRVDNEPEAYGFNGAVNGKRVWVEAPLYIGGLPEYAPQGSLKGRENFRGCIRNIVIDSARTDWTDMYRLHNVLLNACPVH